MYETINEPVDVVAYFGRTYHAIKPFKMRWSNKVFTITHIDYKHKVREGKKIMHVFSCTDGAAFFELKYDSDDVAWTLARTWDGEAN
jgi:hypothetical protein